MTWTMMGLYYTKYLALAFMPGPAFASAEECRAAIAGIERPAYVVSVWCDPRDKRY
jgi:hypothetical protein